MQVTERDLVVKFKEASDKVERLELQLQEAEKEYYAAESAILELLEANAAEATARYDGLGYVRAMKPKLYASFTKENEPKVFTFLEAEGRDDLIKETVHSGSLSTFVKERIEAGLPVPEYIKYYLKAKAQLF